MSEGCQSTSSQPLCDLLCATAARNQTNVFTGGQRDLDRRLAEIVSQPSNQRPRYPAARTGVPDEHSEAEKQPSPNTVEQDGSVFAAVGNAGGQLRVHRVLHRNHRVHAQLPENSFERGRVEERVHVHSAGAQSDDSHPRGRLFCDNVT